MSDSINLWLKRFDDMKRWRRHGERAPHKPLLLLHAIGRFVNEGQTEFAFIDIEGPLRRLLEDFGPPRVPHPEYPFARLANDEELWEVRADTDVAELGESVTRLREAGARGRLTSAFQAVLRDAAARDALVGRLLASNFPSSLHADILDSVGLSARTPAAKPESDARRDPRFREQVLLAYEYECAFCGFDGAIERAPVGIEAAHVRWWASGGADEVPNGLCLCTLHHKLFDRGVLGMDVGHRVLVSQHFIARGEAARFSVESLLHHPVATPQAGHGVVAEDNIEWHLHEVFRGPSRVREG